jgi:hypothetical protein
MWGLSSSTAAGISRPDVWPSKSWRATSSPPRSAAAEDEAAGRNEAGLWNLDRAIEITPEDRVPYAARAALADLAGHPDRATTDEDVAIHLGARHGR